MDSFVKWAGSKRSLVPLLERLLPPKYGRYYEPFCGSACLFFRLGGPKAVLGDLNKELINLYRCVRANPGTVHRKALAFGDPATNYYSVRALSPHRLNIFDQAARFFYLNRHCFNGVFRTNRKGNFNVPLGSRTGSLPGLGHLEQCANALTQADLRAGDFSRTLEDVDRGDFVYLDPPYFKEGRAARGEYGYDSFRANDVPRLMELLESLEQRGAYFLLSYLWTEECEGHFGDWKVDEVVARRHVSGFTRGRSPAREVLVRNYC